MPKGRVERNALKQVSPFTLGWEGCVLVQCPLGAGL